ncbi:MULTISPECIES: hypothetical protein [unclassified Sphingomonas]|uniref:hypothetical protein n=1 Tax=unclassified Sphingomonas TaxID=196159 RepID=UPI0012E3C788|nr:MULTISPECIES: hypothetical protein [unclassified Sphingomonas]
MDPKLVLKQRTAAVRMAAIAGEAASIGRDLLNLLNAPLKNSGNRLRSRIIFDIIVAFEMARADSMALTCG